jgi:hypothetical protein
MKDFVTSIILGTSICLVGQKAGLSQVEIFILCALAGLVQGIIKSILNTRPKNFTIEKGRSVAVGDTITENGVSYAVVAINEDGIVVRKLS